MEKGESKSIYLRLKCESLRFPHRWHKKAIILCSHSAFRELGMQKSIVWSWGEYFSGESKWIEMQADDLENLQVSGRYTHYGLELSNQLTNPIFDGRVSQKMHICGWDWIQMASNGYWWIEETQTDEHWKIKPLMYTLESKQLSTLLLFVGIVTKV